MFVCSLKSVNYVWLCFHVYLYICMWRYNTLIRVQKIHFCLRWAQKLRKCLHDWITITRKSGEHLRMTNGTVDSCFNLIRSHQLYIPWSPPPEIEPVTKDCSAEKLQLSPQFISHTSDAKLTSYGNCTAN